MLLIICVLAIYVVINLCRILLGVLELISESRVGAAFKELLYLIMFITISVSAVSFAVNPKNPVKPLESNIVSRLNHTNVIYSYSQENTEIAQMEEEIYRKYRIHVYSNVDFEEVYGIRQVKVKNEASEEDIIAFMGELDQALGMYRDRALLSVPKSIYLVNGIRSGESRCLGLYNPLYIIYDVENSKGEEARVIHHEIYHALTEQTGIDRLIRFLSVNEGCKATSAYACTSFIEHLADAWSYSLTEGLENKHTAILKELYPVFLKSEEYQGEGIKESLTRSVEKIIKETITEDVKIVLNNIDAYFAKQSRIALNQLNRTALNTSGQQR